MCFLYSVLSQEACLPPRQITTVNSKSGDVLQWQQTKVKGAGEETAEETQARRRILCSALDGVVASVIVFRCVLGHFSVLDSMSFA